MRKPVLITLFSALAVALPLQILYVRTFTDWNIALYALSIFGLSVAIGAMSFAFFSFAQTDRPLLKALLFASIYAAVFVGGTTFLHVVVFKTTHISTTVLCFSALNVALFAVLVASTLKKTDGPRALTDSIAAILIVAISLTSLISVYSKDIKIISQALKTDAFVRPENASARTEFNASENVRLFVNIDETTQIPDLNLHIKDKTEITEDDLLYYIEPYLNTQVTDIMFNVSGQSSASPTNVLTYRGDKFLRTEENGVAVDYSTYRYWWYSLQEKGINPFPIWMKQCRERGINPWLSIRMNDCHDSGEKTSFLRGDLFYEARDKGWMIGKEYGYYHTCLNFAVPEIRKIMLDYVEEQLGAYDVYGLELDWLREIYCFDYLHEDNAKIVSIMNGFMRDVNAIVSDAETKWGHEIKLTARLSRDIDQNKIFGFDVRTWYAEKLVDSITVSPRFSTCDSDMDIRGWKTAFPDLEIYAGLETRVSPEGSPRQNAVADALTARGYAAEYMIDGADGIYLFNYMAYGYLGRNEEIYKTCGNYGTAINASRRHVMTIQDLAPENAERYEPLPVVALKGKAIGLVQKTAPVPKNATVNVYIGTKSKIKENKIEITVNGSPCTFKGEAVVYAENEVGGEKPVENGYVPENTFVYRFSVDDVTGLGDVIYASIINKSLTPLFINYFETEVSVD